MNKDIMSESQLGARMEKISPLTGFTAEYAYRYCLTICFETDGLCPLGAQHATGILILPKRASS